jgi:tRNA threonylcarbamoyladenosine biosynthesis protein TsaE
LHITSESVEETRKAGAMLALNAQACDVYVLEGDLGTGKTEFVRGFANALGKDVIVRSPSFSILNIYKTQNFEIYHFDFYRLKNASELQEIGFDEYVASEGVCLIEWGTMFPEVLPERSKVIRFSENDRNKRTITSEFDF